MPVSGHLVRCSGILSDQKGQKTDRDIGEECVFRKPDDMAPTESARPPEGQMAI